MECLASFPFALLLLIVFSFRIRRERKAREQLESSPINVKLYLASRKKTISDGIKVYAINGKKPLLDWDEGGNYVVVTAKDNNIDTGFVALNDFVPVATMPATAPAVLGAKEKKGSVFFSRSRRKNIAA